MQLESPERSELARFFHKRSADLDIEKIRLRTGIPVRASLIGAGEAEWHALIEQADQMRRLPLLASTIAAQNPNDENLQSICRLLDDRKKRNLERAANLLGGAGLGFISAGVIGVCVGLLAIGLSSKPDMSIAQDQNALKKPVVVAQALKTELQPQTRRPVQNVPSVTKPTKALKKTPSADTKLALQPQSFKPSRTGNLIKRCGVNPGDHIGYFHWGPEEAGAPDAEFVITRSVNVRQDYPNRKNAYDTRTPVRCILRRGERVKPSTDAILVAGGHYWIPLVAGDLIKS